MRFPGQPGRAKVFMITKVRIPIRIENICVKIVIITTWLKSENAYNL